MGMLLLQGLLIIGLIYLFGIGFKKYSPRLLKLMNKNKKASILSMFGIMLTALILLVVIRFNFSDDNKGQVKEVASEIYKEIKVKNYEEYKAKSKRQLQMEQLSYELRRELEKQEDLRDTSKLRAIQLKYKQLSDGKEKN